MQAVICLHGDLLTPLPAKPGDIKAAICVMHGAKDPVVPKNDRDAFEAEMEAAGVKWQMLVFGGLLHSFCEAESDVPGIACFDPGAARQCYRHDRRLRDRGIRRKTLSEKIDTAIREGNDMTKLAGASFSALLSRAAPSRRRRRLIRTGRSG